MNRLANACTDHTTVLVLQVVQLEYVKVENHILVVEYPSFATSQQYRL